MDTEKMREEILQALSEKEFSKIELDKITRGAAIARVIAGKAGEVVIERIYNRLLELRGSRQVVQEQLKKQAQVVQKQPQEQSEFVLGQLQEQITQKSLIDRIDVLSFEIQALKAENNNLRRKLAMEQSRVVQEQPQEQSRVVQEQPQEQSRVVQEQPQEQSRVVQEQPSIQETLSQILERLEKLEGGRNKPVKQETRILGFKITQKRTTTSGRDYQKFYAVNKGKTVYLGSTADNAESKIRAYCTKNNIPLPIEKPCEPIK